MNASDAVQFIAAAAAAGIVGNRMDATVVALGPAQRLHRWLRARLIDPAAIEPSPVMESWIQNLSEMDRAYFIRLLREAVVAAPVPSVGGIHVGRDVRGNLNSNVIGTQNNYGSPRPDAGWEYVSINYGQEGDFDRVPHLKWVAYIQWPGASRLDVRDHVRMPDILNELGRDGWELVSERPAVGINTTEYTLRREKR